MSSWAGSTLTGQEGTKLLLHFSKEADKKQLDDLNAKLGAQYTRYEPWMSHLQMYREFEELASGQYDYKSEQGLRSRKTLFSDSTTPNLSRVLPGDNRQTVMLASEREYKTFLSELSTVTGIFEQCDPYWVARFN